MSETPEAMAPDDDAPIPTVDLRTDIPHSARVYDVILGGKTNFEADRAAAAKMVAAWPELPVSMRANRSFMRRTAAYLAKEVGIRQFLDIGTGIPTPPNLHEVVQAVDPAARVVYADNDPIVLVHARALLTGTPEGRTGYLDGDLREVETILGSPDLRAVLDVSRPVALSLVAVLQFVSDEDAARVVRQLLDALAPGSALVLSQPTSDAANTDWATPARAAAPDLRLRSRAEIAAFFDGLTVLDPGVVLVNRWHPAADDPTADTEVGVIGGVGLKP